MSQTHQQLESLRRHVLNFAGDLDKVNSILSWWKRYNTCLHWALRKEWLLLGWLLSRLLDRSRSRLFQALSEINNKYPKLEDDGIAHPLCELEDAYAHYQKASLRKIDNLASPLKTSNVNQGLGKMILSKYSPAIFGRASHLKRAPGSFLKIVAEFLFSDRVYSEVFEPTLRDLFDDYCAALAANRPWKARWVRTRDSYSFWLAVVNQMPISAAKIAYKIWRATR